jgi:hypothetical protein
MTTITLSANSLGIYDRCPAAYRMYKVLKRRAVRSSAGLIAGMAMHAAFEKHNVGADVPAQEKSIDDTLAATPTDADDYRQATYLKDAFAAFRAEVGSLLAGWTIEEVEKDGTVELGQTAYRVSRAGQDTLYATVLWEFRRDLVAVDPDGRRWIIDLKTSSREEDAQVRAMKNSGQFMGYILSWQLQNPSKPVAGVQPIRVILRKPTKTGVAFGFPRDTGIFFQPERIREWQKHTLRKAREILERDPENADDWPLACAELGCCRHTFGCCDYLDTCLLVPAERALHLSTDAYESSVREEPTIKAQTSRNKENHDDP